MNYPNHLVELADGLSLFIPDVLYVKSTYERLSETEEDTPFPFWATIWPSSLVLTNYLKRNPAWIEGKHVIELGAGIGQPSFYITSKAKSIIISDYSKDAVLLMEKNIQHLGLSNTKAILLDWNNMDFSLEADTVLLSDVNYDSFDFDSLIRIVEHYISKETTIIIATPGRMMGAPFIEKIKHHIKHSCQEKMVEHDTIINVHLYVLFK